MPTDFTLPELGENVTAGDVVRVLVNPGDSVAKDQPVLELETDKATIEVPSSVAGTVKDVRVKQGERIKVGQVVLTVDDGGTAVPPKGGAAKAAADEGAKPKPQPAGAATEGGLSQKAPGQGEAAASSGGAKRAKEDAGQGLADQPEAQQAESVAESKPRRGEVVDISRGARATPAPAASAETVDQGPAAPAAPSVRRLARELGVDIRRVPGSGPGGRISNEDVQAFVRGALAGGGAPATIPPGSLPDFTKWGEVERKPMSNIRRKTAEHLSSAWNQIPHVTQHDKADITSVEELRKKYASQAEKAGGKLTMTAIALKIAATALQRFPQFNASADVARNEIIYRKYVHVGVAADTPRGLLVPVIRDVDRKGIIELAVELANVSEKARAGKLSLDEMQGGGFTITNLGGIGGTSFTPIVNWPDVAILGISRAAFEPVYDGKSFQPRLMLPLSLSYDHRVIDGADGARFLRWIADAFEQPFVLSL
ncbi:MAG TPA: 2-oxo acid dehydrogenase subunit E2 [Vicinamibacterales bacterium]|jgi:pyruvate dehydrogenase E2 component (dihydrolipoyllysine-residue acetyltransferase)|nr:2-oxo acid dehydrogenase subunit E2 [Vicinamibacterales bacterium]